MCRILRTSHGQPLENMTYVIQLITPCETCSVGKGNHKPSHANNSKEHNTFLEMI